MTIERFSSYNEGLRVLGKEEGSIYVINRTEQLARFNGIAHTVVLSVADGQDRRPASVQPSWLPIDLTMFVPRSALLVSTDLRRALANGLLELIPTEHAERLIASPAGQAENERLRKLRDRVASVSDGSQDDGVDSRHGDYTVTDLDGSTNDVSPAAAAAASGTGPARGEDQAGASSGEDRFGSLSALVGAVQAAEIAPDTFSTQVIALHRGGAATTDELSAVIGGNIPSAARTALSKYMTGLAKSSSGSASSSPPRRNATPVKRLLPGPAGGKTPPTRR